MIKSFITVKQSVLLLGISIMLSGCLGGTIAQQIARSVATSVADSAVANAMDVDEQVQQDRFAIRKPVPTKKPVAQQQFSNQNLVGQNLISQNFSGQNSSAQNNINQNTTQQNLALQQSALQNLAKTSAAQQNAGLQKNTMLKETQADPYKLAFINARFEEVKVIEEPLPAELAEIETPVGVVQSNQLVQVELFNLLIGEEKAAVYNNAQLLGATSLPKQREWKLWRVATGVIKHNVNQPKKTSQKEVAHPSDNQQIITFLIPPDFGKLPSGSIALVEIASPGELNIARYKLN